MWYVIWTATGSERKLCAWIDSYVSSSLYDDCFVPVVEQNRKVKDEWRTVKKVLFPGYLFVQTDDKRIERFAERIKHSGQFATVLATDGKLAPLKEEECYLIDSAYGSEGVLEASIGEIEGDKVKIMSGPLKGLEGSIKSINRHKRLATIELTLFGRTSRVVMGLEIISKS